MSSWVHSCFCGKSIEQALQTARWAWDFVTTASANVLFSQHFWQILVGCASNFTHILIVRWGKLSVLPSHVPQGQGSWHEKSVAEEINTLAGVQLLLRVLWVKKQMWALQLQGFVCWLR